jgi:hypothetical protein
MSRPPPTDPTGSGERPCRDARASVSRFRSRFRPVQPPRRSRSRDPERRGHPQLSTSCRPDPKPISSDPTGLANPCPSPPSEHGSLGRSRRTLPGRVARIRGSFGGDARRTRGVTAEEQPAAGRRDRRPVVRATERATSGRELALSLSSLPRRASGDRPRIRSTRAPRARPPEDQRPIARTTGSSPPLG